MNSVRTRQIFCALLALAACVGSCSGDRNQSKSKSSPEGSVQVDGKTSDDSVTDYKQSQDSVEIGGVNLAGVKVASEYSVTATLISASVRKVLYSGTFTTSAFAFKLKRPGGYVKVEVTSPDGSVRSNILAPAFKDRNAYVVVNATTSIAAKLYEIICERAAAGDESAKKVIARYALSVTDLHMAAASVKMTVDQQKASAKSVDPINLSSLAVLIAEKSAANYDTVAPVMGGADMAAVLSATAYNSVFGSEATSVDPTVLAYRAQIPEGGIDVPYKAMVAFNTPTVLAAYKASVDAYRPASSSTAAAAETTNVSTSYASTYNSCYLTPDSCVSSTWTPTPPSTSTSSTTESSTYTSTSTCLNLTDGMITTGGMTTGPTTGTMTTGSTTGTMTTGSTTTGTSTTGTTTGSMTCTP